MTELTGADFIGALDRVEEMCCVLALFEGVASGAADGYGRISDIAWLARRQSDWVARY